MRTPRREESKIYRIVDRRTVPWDRFRAVWRLWLMILFFVGSNSNGDACSSGNRFPYLVSIRNPGSRTHVCTGTLIAERYVLTAAHCVDPDSLYSAGRRPIVHAGPRSVDEFDDSVEVIQVSESIFHPRWDKTQRSPFNVAILQLSVPSAKKFPIIHVDHFQLRTGQLLTVAGWGSGGTAIEVGSNVFGATNTETLEYISVGHCNRESLWNGTVAEGLCCGLNNHQLASCLADSGSPLLLVDKPDNDLEKGYPSLDFVIGINVDGAPCGTPQKPDVYAQLGSIHTWIFQHTSA